MSPSSCTFPQEWGIKGAEIACLKISEQWLSTRIIGVGKLVRPCTAIWAVLFIALVLPGGLSCINSGSSSTKVNFLLDWDAAKEQAASQSKPIMINFYTDT